jgi:hypothetical protein
VLKKEIMRQIYSLLILSLILTNKGFAQGGVIILEGNYQGKNLYVQNPFGSGGVGFCVTEVLVNGNITTDETNSSAFEIDFKSHKLVIGEKIEIKIKHKEDCKPKVLNPEVLKPKSTFEVIDMKIDKDGTLKWSTKSETGKLDYAVEQFRWNKWVKVGEVSGNGTASTNNYTFKIAPHSGKNQVRVRQTDYSGQPRLSRSVDFMSEVPIITFAPLKVAKEISFVAADKAYETMYEIYDQYGNVVKRGFGSSIDASNLAKGGYFLNYDNKMGEFIKK